MSRCSAEEKGASQLAKVLLFLKRGAWRGRDHLMEDIAQNIAVQRDMFNMDSFDFLFES
jgi:hypothetical protein